MEWYFFHELVQNGPFTLGEHKTHFNDAREARLRWHDKGRSPENGVSTYVDVASRLLEHYG